MRNPGALRRAGSEVRGPPEVCGATEAQQGLLGGSPCSNAAESWERGQRVPVGGDDMEVTLIKAVWEA